MANKYEVKWRGETYFASDLTDALKFKYCQWLYGYMLENAKRYKTAKEFLEFDRKLTASPPEWTSVPDASVLESLGREPGQLQLMRLVLNLDQDAMSDADFNEMIEEKEKDANSDLNRAMKLIREDSDPKAPKGGGGSPRPAAESEPTPRSATNPSDSNGVRLAS